MEGLAAELGEKNAKLEILAREDGLTGLANRRHFNEVLDAEMVPDNFDGVARIAAYIGRKLAPA